MSVMNRSLIIFLIFATQVVWGKNYLSFMGGGGEPPKDTTIFDNQIGPLANFTKHSNWQTQISFNGGHKETEKKITNGFKNQGLTNTSFTKEAFNQNIKFYEDKIKNGEIVAGEQIMLIISTHGAIKSENEKTHQITLKGGEIKDFTTGAGASMISLDALSSLTELAKTKGIKLAIVDLSCHSGSSLALKNENTCVISASGPNHYGYSGLNTFTEVFVKSMKRGQSLEEIYLTARSNFVDNSFPMISSPVGIEINNELYDPITPYLYYFDKKFDKFSPFYNQAVKNGEACETPKKFSILNNLIEDIRSQAHFHQAAVYKDENAQNFKDALKNYYDYINQLKSNHAKLKIPNLEKKEKFCQTYDQEKKTCLSYSLENIINFDYETSKQFYKASLKADNAPITEALLQITDQIEARKRELLAEFPDLKIHAAYLKNIPDLELKTKDLANKVSHESRILYQSMYRQKSLQNKQPNPCRDFKL